MGLTTTTSNSSKKGTIEWFLAKTPSELPADASKPFKRPRVAPDQQQQQRPPHLALRSSNHCQQLLAQELGWRSPSSLNTWQSAQQQQLSCICLRAVPEPSGSIRTIGQRADCITCLAVQQQQHPNSSSSSNRLVAAVDSHSTLHICPLSRLHAAAQSALNAAAALPDDERQALLHPDRWTRRAAAAGGVPLGAGAIPTAAATAAAGNSSNRGVLSIAHSEQLRSCCWLQAQHNAAGLASSSKGVLITSGRSGVSQRVFAQDRHVSSSLRAKGGSIVEAAGMVVALDAQAAYQLAAVSDRSMLLWDLRASPAAAAQLPVQAQPSVLRALPGGQLLLTAESNGQVSLYDVRRLSSSSIVNFGSSRGSQQLLVAHNLKARAQAAGYGSSSSSSSVAYGVAHDLQFLSDVVVNPADPNLLAYIRPQLQAGLFDLASGQVLQHVPLCHRVDAAAAAAAATSSSTTTTKSSQAPAAFQPLAQAGCQCCWDSSGRVLYTQGLMIYGEAQQGGPGGVNEHCGGDAGAVDFAPTLAAVDFGSWHGRSQRWSSCTPSSVAQRGHNDTMPQRHSSQDDDDTETVADAVEAGGGGGDQGGLQESSAEDGVRVRLCQGGQLLHRELNWVSAPSALAAAGDRGEVLAGTLWGDLLWLG